MKKVKQPFNSFKNQIIIIKTNEEKETVSQTIFTDHFRHTIYYNDSQILCNKLKEVVRPNVTNALRVENEEIFHFGKDIIRTFPNCTFVQAQTLLIDITNIDRQKEIIIQTHRRAHRNYKNNAQEILLNYYWPNLKKMCSTETNICEICLVHKYERQPNRQPIGKTPIPTRVGEYIQMDIFHMNNNTYLSSIDRYSKYCFIRKLENKLHCHEYIEEVLTQIYSNAKYLMTDNESIFIGNMAKSVYSRLQITHSVTPVHHSTSNAQVERLHSTLIELCQTLAAENKTAPADELYNAVCQ